ncbi:MAG: FAD-binding domain-containing protein [Pseudomonadota bacterium]
MPPFEPSRAAAEAALQAFLPRAGHAYRAERNHDRGPGHHSAVSRLSPWLRHRLLLEDDVLRAVAAQHTVRDAEAYLAEVLWRGYFRGHLEHRPAVWARYLEERIAAQAALQDDDRLREQVETATRGETGIACFDAWVHELRDTGYLHNHARMWFASIWVFTLRLPWQLGADVFLTHLIDGDPAANTGSWRWVAGLHTPGKTYCATADNIARFTGGRFGTVTGLADTAPALTESPLPPPQPPVFSATAPLPAGARLGLLLLESDCQAESLPLPQAPASVLALTDPCARSVAPLAPAAAQFTRAALSDALQRAGHAFDLTPHGDDREDWRAAVRDWLNRDRVDAIAVARPPIGWVHDRVEPVLRALELDGVPLHRITRVHDQRVWPHSSKGFFKLKKPLSQIVASAVEG